MPNKPFTMPSSLYYKKLGTHSHPSIPTMPFLSTTFTFSCQTNPSPCLPTLFTACHKNTSTPSGTVSVDRRGMLLGLSGLYATATHVSSPALAMAAPRTLSQQHPNCHYYAGDDTLVDYEYPSQSTTPVRVRRAAHLVDGEYVARYQEAVRRMKALPEGHPWNFYTMAKNHVLEFHDNWLFLPWHRFKIYFYERILGKLIDDPTFALPFWNFDAEDGMSVPDMFIDPTSALYNSKRDKSHFPPAVVDFWYVYGAKTPTGTAENVEEIRRVFRQSLGRASLFMGDPIAGKDEELGSGGRLDSMHKSIHQWVGPATAPWMDMGNVHTSPRDPVFYSLHGNMDRLWQLYRTMRGNVPDFDDEKWLNHAFMFVDENGQHVRVKVRDCLEPLKLGYTYEEVPIPWAGPKPTNAPKVQPKPNTLLTSVNEFGPGPKALVSPTRVLVPRPKPNRTSLEKRAELEVLHIRGIDVIPSGPARVDVYVAAPQGGTNNMVGTDFGEFAGSYVKPLTVHTAAEAGRMAEAPPTVKRRKGCLKLGITPLLEDMDAEGVENLVVTLVPTDGEITVDSIGIVFLEADRRLLL